MWVSFRDEATPEYSGPAESPVVALVSRDDEG